MPTMVDADGTATSDPLEIAALADAVRGPLARTRHDDVDARLAQWDVARHIARHAERPEVLAAAESMSPKGPGRPRSPRRVVIEELAKVMEVSPRTLVRWFGEWERVALILDVLATCGQAEFLDIVSKNSKLERIEQLLAEAYQEEEEPDQPTAIGSEDAATISPRSTLDHLQELGALPADLAARLSELLPEEQSRLLDAAAERAGIDVSDPERVDRALAETWVKGLRAVQGEAPIAGDSSSGVGAGPVATGGGTEGAGSGTAGASGAAGSGTALAGQLSGKGTTGGASLPQRLQYSPEEIAAAERLRDVMKKEPYEVTFSESKVQVRIIQATFSLQLLFSALGDRKHGEQMDALVATGRIVIDAWRDEISDGENE